MASKLFQYAIIWNPKPQKDQMGNDVTPPSSIIVEPTFKLAKNENEVAMLAARSIPESYLDKLDQVDVIVRPF